MLGYQYYASHHLPVIRLRPFNHIGPGQSPAFVASAFAKQIAEVEAGLREPVVRVGNLEARRDISDVRDIVGAYHLAITEGEPGEVYNVGAGRSVSIRQLLEMLISMSRTPVAVQVDPELLRPSDVPEIIADCAKIHSATGWRAKIPLEQSLKDVLDYWRKSVTS
jgi:GDP-4-dehydro-6-deoxy-D-mannose reductase